MRRIMHGYMVWKYEQLPPWFKKHKGSWFFKFFEHAAWFPWYGKRIVYVQSKDPSTLSDPQVAIKQAIKDGEYQNALDIVESMPQTKQTMLLRQVIGAKIK